jgi:hypothetical protein
MPTTPPSSNNDHYHLPCLRPVAYTRRVAILAALSAISQDCFGHPQIVEFIREFATFLEPLAWHPDEAANTTAQWREYLEQLPEEHRSSVTDDAEVALSAMKLRPCTYPLFARCVRSLVHLASMALHSSVCMLPHVPAEIHTPALLLVVIRQAKKQAAFCELDNRPRESEILLGIWRVASALRSKIRARKATEEKRMHDGNASSTEGETTAQEEEDPSSSSSDEDTD